MTFDEYQDTLLKLSFKNGEPVPVTVCALGLVGEAGEVADLLKKQLWHGRFVQPAEFARELGDVLWYVQALANLFGFSLSEIAQMNIDKLKHRYPNGFVEGGGNR